MKQTFQKITEKKLKAINCKLYSNGKELEIGNKVCYGFIVNYVNLNGTPSSEINPNEVSFSLQMFVEKNGTLYQLYKSK